MAIEDDDADAPAEALARKIRRLSYAGLVPALALGAWLAAVAPDHPRRAQTVALLAAYSALILTFFAGARWGLAVARRPQAGERDALIALGLAAAAWAALVVPPPDAFVMLAIAFAAQGAWDAFAVHAGTLPEWYGRIRTHVTFVMVAAMVAAFVAIN